MEENNKNNQVQNKNREKELLEEQKQRQTEREEKRKAMEDYYKSTAQQEAKIVLSTYLVEIGSEGITQKLVIEARNIMEALAKFTQIHWHSLSDLDILGVSLEEIEYVK